MNRLLHIILVPLESLFARATRTSRVHPRSRGLLLVSYHPYRGRPLTLPDGTVINRGTLVGELHLANRHLNRIVKPGQMSEWGFLHALRQELLQLAEQITGEKISPAVIAFYGLTLMGPGAKRLGFYTRPVPRTPFNHLIAVWERFLSRAYALPFARTRLKRELTEIWISRSWLLLLLTEKNRPETGAGTHPRRPAKRPAEIPITAPANTSEA